MKSTECASMPVIYPASWDCLPGKITEFVLMTEERPKLEVVAVDVRELADYLDAGARPR